MANAPLSTGPIDAVIFDCDGTLVDSEPLLLEVMVAEAVKLGMSPAISHDVAAIEGQSMASSLRMLEARLGRPLPADFLATLRAEMAIVFRARLKEMPGAHAMLQCLSLPFCVASNGPRAKIELVLEVAGMLPLFAGRIFSADEVGSYKPEPDLFLHAAAQLGARPERCVVVEDSLAGIRAGLAAGMQVYAYRPVQALPADLLSRVTPLRQLSDLCAEHWNRVPIG
jgi:HAD superfamily hydrolase (TIGR01509 family)